MKILFISGADLFGGTFHMARNILEYFEPEKMDIQFVVITPQFGNLNEWCNIHKIENYVLPYKYCVYYPSKNRLVTLLKRTLKRVIVSVCNAVALKKFSLLQIEDDIDLIHTNINRDLFGMMISRKYHIPNITHLRELLHSHFGLELLYNNQLDFMVSNTSRFLAISNTVKLEWSNYYGIPDDKIHVIYDGIDVSCFIDPSRGEIRDVHRIIMAGGVYPGKGQFILIQAIHLLKNWGVEVSADIYGQIDNQNYYSEMKKYILGNGLSDYVRFMGHSDSINNVLPNYDIGIVCSKAEGFGLATVEFLSAGLVVIASDTGANPEILHEGEYGYLFSEGNAESLADKIIGVINDWGSAKQKAAKGQGYSVLNYNIMTSMEKLIGEYESNLYLNP